MTTLHITITDADDSTRQRAIQALQEAGIDVDRTWLEPRMTGSAVPNRDHLKGQRVKLKLNPWASSGPTEGVFSGQGEKGLSIIVSGGGRYIYRHHEVAKVEPA